VLAICKLTISANLTAETTTDERAALTQTRSQLFQKSWPMLELNKGKRATTHGSSDSGPSWSSSEMNDVNGVLLRGQTKIREEEEDEMGSTTASA
jgi:hypothetical protein